ncbi:MAG: VWA domain-containing protein [Bryobacteraceae bacterium]
MVDLNVVALDSRGQAVTDLTRDDFRVADNGKPQIIASFRHRDSALGAVPTLAPKEFSNRNRANVPRATVILFDLLNERFSTRGTTANQLVHDLESLESADYVYLYCLNLDGRLVPIHGLPGPESEPAPPGIPPWTRQIKQLLDSAMRALNHVRPIDDFDWTYRVELTYAALNAVAVELSRVPGRKSLVWLTDSVPIELGPNRSDTGDWVDFTPDANFEAMRSPAEMKFAFKPLVCQSRFQRAFPTPRQNRRPDYREGYRTLAGRVQIERSCRGL